MDRRGLFSSFAKPFGKKQESEEVIVRPPYFLEEDSFAKECIDCDGICSTFCQENIIIISNDKTPKLDFSKGGCTYCDECAINCPKEVLNVEYKKQIDVKIDIDILKCMSWNQTMCFSCKDPCLEDAISFLGMFRPKIEDTKCTSCGFCISVCPTNAITIKKES